MSVFLGERSNANGIRGKRGGVMQEIVIHIILIALVLAVFVMANAGRINGRDVRQQVLEKQLALLIDSAEDGMVFEISKINANGIVDSVDVRDSRIYVGVDGFRSVRGYPYYSRYSVSVEDYDGRFFVRVEK